MKTIGKSTKGPESTGPWQLSKVNRFGHRALPASSFSVERKELPKSMMIGKALLSGL